MKKRILPPQKNGLNGGMLLFSGRAHRQLARRIAASLKMKLGKMVLKEFKDGETFVKFDQNIRGQEVFIIQPTNAPARNILELLFMIDAARRASARRITVVIPYYGYARGDKKDEPRISITAKLIANLLVTAGADRILTMDLHASQIQGFFDVPLDHLYASSVFMPYLEKLKIPNMVVVAPDTGATKAVRAYAKHFNCPIAIIDKRRSKPNAIEKMTLIGRVRGKIALLIDDICDTAGTLTKAAAKLKEKGAIKVIAACSHALLSGDAAKKIAKSPIELILFTDTVRIGRKKLAILKNKARVVPTHELFGKAIKHIHEEDSITELFIS